MKWLKMLGALLAAVIVLSAGLLISGFGILFQVTASTDEHPVPAGYGRLPTWRCQYFTAQGTFSFETTTESYGDDVCYPVKRPTPSSWNFRRTSFS